MDARKRRTIQEAARMVRMREAGHDAVLVSRVRISRLDPEDKPTGERVDLDATVVTFGR
jgi:hypothetical protein